MSDYIIESRDVHKRFNLDAGLFARFGNFVYALNGVSFNMERGLTFGLVGESGCGKTTLARLLVRLYNFESGSINFRSGDGRLFDVHNVDKAALKLMRAKIKYIFQDPARSLNPRFNIYQILTAGYRYLPTWPGEKIAREEAEKILEAVGMQARDLDRRPTEFSGGQRQRISIARALITRPEFIICDEIVSALDVSIQSQILNLLIDLRKAYNLSLLFIAHDLSVASYFCDNIAVMYRGTIVEIAPAQKLMAEPRHPYSELLYNSMPSRLAATASESVTSEKTNSSFDSSKLAEGCVFAHRCPKVMAKCHNQQPPRRSIAHHHEVACFAVE